MKNSQNKILNEKKKKENLLSIIKLKAPTDLQNTATDISKKLTGFIISLPVNSTPYGDFAKEKGKLKWPVTGRILVSFGKKKSSDGIILTSKGIVIKAKKSQTVRAVFEGKVVFADWFKGYGKLIIIDHGNSYYTLYGHLGKIRAKERVHTGDVIGLSGNTDAPHGASLYFELRKKGKEQSPLTWLNKL